MLQAGSYHTLTVNRISDYGLYLADEEGNEVLLPNRYVSLADRIGDTKEVFVYHDTENRLTATTEPPYSSAASDVYKRQMQLRAKRLFSKWWTRTCTAHSSHGE